MLILEAVGVDTFIGFDSAWADNPKARGAICALVMEDNLPREFHPPRLVSFCEALQFTKDVQAMSGCTVLALDQPTIVPNQTSMRPVERVAASLVSWLGGGVQPSNRNKVGMFCDASPIWKFLEELGGHEDPEEARVATSGLHLVEVFPALALPSIDTDFFGRLAAPRYNPQRRKTFRLQDWMRVARAAANGFDQLGFDEQASWCHVAALIGQPRKPDQDMLDAMLCLLVALRWRLLPRSESMLLGCLKNGYMVLPASQSVRERLMTAARKCVVPVDGVIPV